MFESSYQGLLAVVRSKFSGNKFDLDEMIQSINRKAWWNMNKKTTVDEILNFWFNECTPEQRYKKDADFDALISKVLNPQFLMYWIEWWSLTKFTLKDILL